MKIINKNLLKVLIIIAFSMHSLNANPAQKQKINRIILQAQQAIAKRQATVAQRRLNEAQKQLNHVRDVRFKRAKLLVVANLRNQIKRANHRNKVNVAKNHLDWSIKGPRGETRVQHISKHKVNDRKKQYHGIFFGNPVKVVNDAWNKRQRARVVRTRNNDTYHIRYPNAGKLGGSKGRGQKLNYITIITKARTNRLITAFPSPN